MASFLCKRNFPITLIIINLLFTGCSAAGANASPQISLSLPYTGKKGVLTLSEETPLNSYLAIMQTTDNDSGPAGEVECRTNNPYINIPLVYPKTYKIELAKELDRETDKVLQVSILCSDKGVPPMTSTAAFTIEILDVNDNAPIFGKLSYIASVIEGAAVGTLVTTVVATDPDSELNGVIQYSLHDEAVANYTSFTIDKETGQIFTNADFDREIADQYNITIVAIDSGLPALSSTVQVRIDVEDINDNEPVILTKSILVKEGQKPMSRVGKIEAIDSDTGKNAELVFSKVENSKSSSPTPFLVQPGGEILSAVSLDREQRPLYVMEVAVRDKGKPRQSSTATVTIIVNDVNDNVPIITSPCLYDDNFSFLADVDNSSSGGFITIDWYSPEDETVVYKVEAIDEDIRENGQLHFAIESVTTSNKFNTSSSKATHDLLFKINEDTGEIFLRRFVRKNDHLIQILNISVIDKGDPPLTAYCALNITLNVDIAHLTPSKTPNARIKSNKRARKYRNGASTTGLLTITCLPGCVSLALYFLLVGIFANDLLSF